MTFVLIKLFGEISCSQFPMVVIATNADVKNERECESIVIKKWADAEKGSVKFVQLHTCSLQYPCTCFIDRYE